MRCQNRDERYMTVFCFVQLSCVVQFWVAGSYEIMGSRLLSSDLS